MSLRAKFIFMFLVVALVACNSNNRVISTTPELVATVTPFTLPSTWTPVITSSPPITSTSSSILTSIPETILSVSFTPSFHITTSPLPNIDDIGLWKLLSLYGQPSNVYINTVFDSPTGEVPFFLLIYYDTIGSIILYSDWATVDNEKIYFCSKSVKPVATDSQDLTTDDRLTFFDAFVSQIDYWLNDSTGLLPLQDSSNFSVEQFYLNFHDQNSSSCIVTLSDIWVSDSISYPTSTQTPIYP